MTGGDDLPDQPGTLYGCREISRYINRYVAGSPLGLLSYNTTSGACLTKAKVRNNLYTITKNFIIEERKIEKQRVQEIVLNDVLIPALQYLYEFDYDNIKFDVSERNICARLALHMENIMRRYDAGKDNPLFAKYFADVEYNRMGNGDIKRYENSEHLPKEMVSDLFIQSRGEAPNYLAVEMKKKKNLKNREEDRVRLKSLVSPKPTRRDLPCVYGTLLCAFIIYSPKDVVIELYENTKGQGELAGTITMTYDKTRRCLL